MVILTKPTERPFTAVSFGTQLLGASVPENRIRSPQQGASGEWIAMQLREVGNLVA